MSLKILMPALSPTMKEGILQKWLVKIGDKVKAGDVLAEIETDKATMEVEAVDEGIITNILVKEGTEGIAVNSPIAILNGSEKSKKNKIENKNKGNNTSDKETVLKTKEKEEKAYKSSQKEPQRAKLQPPTEEMLGKKEARILASPYAKKIAV